MAIEPMTKVERRNLGRFDTPRPIAQAITDWAVRKSSDLVLEPSSGGGAFVQSIMRRLKELGSSQIHKQVVACDIDPRALEETRKKSGIQSTQLVLGNFLDLGIKNLHGRKFNSIVGNPPYVRLHAMNAESRASARRSLPSETLLNAKAGLWAYFPIHAFKFLEQKGNMAWVLPETILHSEYGQQLLRWSGNHFRRCIALSLRERCFIAEGAKERIVILLLEDAGNGFQSEIEMIEHEQASTCISWLASFKSRPRESLPCLNGHAVPHLISSAAADAAHRLEISPDLKPLGNFANIKIGVVTGDNNFFVLNDDQRLAHKLRPHHFENVISKFVDLGEGFDLRQTSDNTVRRWLLCPNPNSQDTKLKAYLEKYSEADIDSNQTMQKRSHWQRPVLGRVPNAFLRYMGKKGPRIVMNALGSYSTNTIHGVYFNDRIGIEDQRAICLALHSTYSQLSAEFEGRQYGSGVLKLEPSEARKLRFPANTKVLTALKSDWPLFAKRAYLEGWEAIVPEIDELVKLYSPDLASSLPLEDAKVVLEKVRRRRNGH